MSEFLPILLYAAILLAVGAGLLWVNQLVAPRKPSPEKGTPYECGVPPLASAHEGFSIKFYVVAMLFLLFDVETALLLPWSVVHRSLGWAGLVEVGTFLAVLGLGLVYALRKGALSWH